MTNALRILQTFDKHLARRYSLTLYGRAALSLGFSDPTPEQRKSLDVDLILTLADSEMLMHAMDFWDALEAANTELSGLLLYLHHIFREDQAILLPEWHQTRVKLSLQFRHLEVWRLDSLNLILSKMMRADPGDLDDIRFLLAREDLSVETLQRAFVRARVPDFPEYHDIFNDAQPKVLEIARTVKPQP